MPVSNNSIGSYFDSESVRVLEGHKDVKSLRAYLKLLRTHLDKLLQSRSDDGEGELNSPADLFELCSEVDLALEELSKEHPSLIEMAGIISSIRAKVSAGIIESMFEEKIQGLHYGAVLEHRQLTSERDLGKEMLSLLECIKQEDPTIIISPAWIRINYPAKYASISKLIKDPESGILDWHKVRDMLPRDLLECSNFVRDRFDSDDKRLIDRITHYRKISECLGPEFLADFLMVSEPALAKSFNHTLKIIRKYLGPTISRVPTPKEFFDLPPATLKSLELRKVVFLNLRNYVYLELIENVDGSLNATEHKKKLKKVKEHLMSVLDASQKEHLALVEDVIEYFNHALNLPVPKRIQREVNAPKTDEKLPVPSLRQRIAMVELEKEKILLLAFFMDTGKTAASFLCKEHVGAKKMLFICTNGAEMSQTVASQVKKHYREDATPSTGIITSKCSQEEIDKALEAEIIIMPYSVLTARKREAGKITEQLYKAGIDFLTVDEAQWAKKEGGLFTDEIRKFTEKIPGLKHTLLLSGDPVPNSPNDILPHLRLKYPEEFIQSRSKKHKDSKDKDSKVGDYGAMKMQSLRHWIKRNDPLRLRALLLDFILNLDPPGDWERFVEQIPIQLSPSQQAHYNAVLENDQLETTSKINQLSLALINPALGSPTSTENATLDICFDLVVKDFEEHDSVVIAQDSFRDGIVDRKWVDGLEHVPSFMEQLESKLEAHYGPGRVIVHGIHGLIPDDDRIPIFRDVKEPPEGKKVVLCSMLKPIMEGINLSQVNRAILLYPTMRTADTSQFVKRFARDGSDVKVRVLTCPDTIFEGIDKHSKHKYFLNQRLLHGGTVTDEDMALLARKDESEKEYIHNGRLVIGTRVCRSTKNNRQMMDMYNSHVQNKGEAKMDEFVDAYGQHYAECYMKNWNGTYSANNGRFVAGLLDGLVEQGDIPKGQYADLACGPLVLENTYGLMNPSARIVNFDINPFVMDEGMELLRERKHQPAYTPTRKVSRMTKLDVRDGAFSFVNCASALQCLGQAAKKIYKNCERAMALIEMNRVLVNQGVALITLPPNVCDEEQFEAFKLEMQNFGFEVMEKYSGQGISTDDEDGSTFHNFVITLKKVGLPKYDQIHVPSLNFTRRYIASANKSNQKEPSEDVRSSHHNEFEINENTLKYEALSGEKLAKVDEIGYQRLVNSARALLLKIHRDNGGSLDILSDQQGEELVNAGVIALRAAGVKGDGKWSFSLIGQQFKSRVIHQLFEDIEAA